MTLQEVAAVKEYPGGFSLLRLHTGGYALNFHKSCSEQARTWSERSRQEMLGYWPQFAFGNTVGDRNTVVKRTCPDCTGRTTAGGTGHQGIVRSSPRRLRRSGLGVPFRRRHAEEECRG